MNRDAPGDCRGLCRFAEVRQFRVFAGSRAPGPHPHLNGRLSAEGLGYSPHFGYPCGLAFGTVWFETGNHLGAKPFAVDKPLLAWNRRPGCPRRGCRACQRKAWKETPCRSTAVA